MYKHKLIIICCLITFLILGYYAYYLYKKNMNLEYIKKAREVTQLFQSGQTDIISDLQNLLKDPPNKSEEGRLKLLLAASFWGRGQEGDLVEAVKIYKKIIDDFTIPPLWRAQALNNVADMIRANELSFFQVYFPESFYKEVLPTEGLDRERVMGVYAGLLKKSDEIHPTSYAEYSLAGNYYTSLLASNRVPLSEIEQVASLIYRYIQEGDGRGDATIYSPWVRLTGLYYRALGTTRSSMALNTVIASSTDIEAAYQQIFTTADLLNQKEPAGASYGVLMRSRFFYANYLTNLQGRDSDINKILEPFSQVEPSHPRLRFFSDMKNLPEGNFLRVATERLMQKSEAFKLFMEKAGMHTPEAPRPSL